MKIPELSGIIINIITIITKITNIIISIIIVVHKMKIPELSRGDETVAILVEDAERLPDLLLAALLKF